MNKLIEEYGMAVVTLVLGGSFVGMLGSVLVQFSI